ncbi:MAG: hypothetical protein ACUVRP_02590 [Chlorobiales bacterium]
MMKMNDVVRPIQNDVGNTSFIILSFNHADFTHLVFTTEQWISTSNR